MLFSLLYRWHITNTVITSYNNKSKTVLSELSLSLIPDSLDTYPVLMNWCWRGKIRAHSISRTWNLPLPAGTVRSLTFQIISKSA